jgi:hypothetical protein
MPEAVARELISAMRMILTLGGRRKQLLDMRRQNIKDLLRKMGNAKVVGVYNEFAIAHDKTEKRVSFRLPVIEDLEGEGRQRKRTSISNSMVREKLTQDGKLLRTAR